MPRSCAPAQPSPPSTRALVSTAMSLAASYAKHQMCVPLAPLLTPFSQLDPMPLVFLAMSTTALPAPVPTSVLLVPVHSLSTLRVTDVWPATCPTAPCATTATPVPHAKQATNSPTMPKPASLALSPTA